MAFRAECHTVTSHAISIVGAGNMGHGLAAQMLAHGHDVHLTDHRESNLETARARVEDVFAFLEDEEIAAVPPGAFDRLSTTTDAASAVSAADFVIETVPEDLDLKRDVFGTVTDAAPDDAVLASNTSSIPITELADGFPDAAPRMVGCHWWYPPYLLTPVEVVRGERTADDTVDRMSRLLEDVDRDPIHVERDVPGFIWNRIQRAVFRECLYLVEEGIGSVDDINRAIRDGYATRTAVIGPFETIDVAGLDQILPGTERIQPTLCNDAEPSRLYEEYLDAGRGGIDDGAGFFEYDEPPEEITARRDRKIAALRRALSGRDDA